jgi:dihydroxyacetone kinase
MTRILNEAENFKNEMIDGLVAAYGRYLRRVPDASGVAAVGSPQPGKVSLVIGGGSGHYPAFCGYTGRGIADAAVIGDVFTSPSAEQVYRVAKAVATDQGVLLSYGNYNGDVMNFGMAERRLAAEGVAVRTVLVTDDVASAPPTERAERRGVAGGFFVYKAAGAQAERGGTLDDVAGAAELANDRTRTFGLAFDGCTLPGRDKPLFRVEPGTVELGLGIHGEPGTASSNTMPAAELGALLVDRLLADPAGPGGRVAVLLNGQGAFKYEEMFVLYSTISKRLDAAGLDVAKSWVGEFVTSLDMPAVSLSIVWLDDELEQLLDAPADTPAFTCL